MRASIATCLLVGVLAEAALDTASLGRKYFGNDATWYATRIPFFEISDQQIQDVYYYRWSIYRAHQRDLGQRGFVSTEFLDDVSWQLEPWATLNDAAGFHLAEGRWLRDRRYADDYINHMYNGGNDRHFSDWIADAVYGRYLVDGDDQSLTKNLYAMANLYNQWDDAFDSSKGLYWREPLYDATEYTISSIDASGGRDGFGGGFAFRPSINAYQYANAIAIAKTATLAGDTNTANTFNTKATTLKSRFQDQMWNTTLQHFIDRYQRDTPYNKYFDPIRGRELVGLVPWMFSMPDDTTTYAQAWSHLMDTNRLRGVSGMRTNEPSYQYYMRQYRYDGQTGLRECQWNGPVWPFQTSPVLYGMANILNTYKKNNIVTKKTYLDELRRYTKLHYLPNGTLDLSENYEPDKAGPLVLLPRSHHYFHSSYNDLIISGLIGLRPRADSTLEVNPLLPSGSDISYFRLQDISYHGHSVAIQWDASGNRYGNGVGLRVEVDGGVVATSSTLTRVTAIITKAAAPAVVRTQIAKSIQLYRDQFPKGSASSGNDAERIHDAIDGRIWFYPEIPQGWDSDTISTASTQWYTIDFGQMTAVSGCDLAFFDNGNDFVAPKTYDILKLVNGNWVKIWGFGETLVANGITRVTWDTISTSQIKVSFPQAAGKRTRLVEFKVY